MNNAVSTTSRPPRTRVRPRACASLSTDCSVFDRLLPTETLLFSGDTAAAGTFACPTDNPLFGGGMPSTAHCIVFSRTPVWIQHEGAPWYVADPTVVTFHSRGRAYRRRRVSDAGDRCDWIALRDDVVRHGLPPWSPVAADRRPSAVSASVRRRGGVAVCASAPRVRSPRARRMRRPRRRGARLGAASRRARGGVRSQFARGAYLAGRGPARARDH